MRWADMDLLGHVNNVRYLDYVAEAREDFFRGSPTGQAQIIRHRVEFAAPLVFRRRPVLVDSWVTDLADDHVTLAHEVYDVPDSDDNERVVHLRVTSELAAAPAPAERERLESLRAPDHDWRPVGRPVADEHRPGGDVYSLTVRRADIDEHGFARDVAFFEFLQEARITFLMGLHTRGQHWSHHVVARTDLTYLGQLARRREPYTVRSWIGHVGTRSFTIQSEVLDGDQAMARASVVMVIFDVETQRPTDMTESQRERLLQEAGGSSAE
jgi:acyl-CoA thioester hydrolase